MTTWIAFLRAVNVGKRQYPMAELRAALTEAGFADVETHIQTGNVRFGTRMRSRERIVAALEETMEADRGFAVPVVLMTPAELRATYAEARALSEEHQPTVHYLALLAEPPSAEAVTALEARSREGEQVVAGERAVHLLLTTVPFHEARTGNAEVERHAGVATTRNLSVVTKLDEKWGA